MTSSPIDPDSVRGVLQDGPFAARTLPAQAYLSEEVLRFELEHFFRASWICVGRTDDVREPGDQVERSMLGQSLLLVRDADGTLRGYFNSCRHRGHELLPKGGCAHRKTIACPYHNWTYNLDGSLRGAPAMRGADGFEASEFPLVGFPVREWHGFAFANLDGRADSFESQLGNLWDVPAPWEPERCRRATGHVYDAQTNWKLVFENYMECYHCPSIHPALCRVSKVGSEGGWNQVGLWAGGPMELEDHAATMSLDGTSGGVRFRGLDERQAREVIYLSILPNLLLSLHPDYVMTHLLDPVAPGVTRVECDFLFAPESLDRTDFDPCYAADFWDITNREDLGACEAVQRGLASAGYRPGPFAEEEVEVLAVQRMFATGYLEGRMGRLATA